MITFRIQNGSTAAIELLEKTKKEFTKYKDRSTINITYWNKNWIDANYPSFDRTSVAKKFIIMNRQRFLRTSFLATGALIASPTFGLGKNTIQDQDPPKLNKELVEKFVGAGHGKYDLVKELLEEHPTLLNAAHDWKGGDFETALGAASHVGYKELAQYLIDKGAQVNIFTAALFGRMDIVKPMLDFFPNTLHSKGPHGYTLLHHAQQGGDEAKEVATYLESLGAKETKIKLY